MEYTVRTRAAMYRSKLTGDALAEATLKVTILRHEAFAHRSAHISYNDVFKLADVMPSELRDLTDTALQIANHLLVAHGLQRQYLIELPRETAQAMMKALMGAH